MATREGNEAHWFQKRITVITSQLSSSNPRIRDRIQKITKSRSARQAHFEIQIIWDDKLQYSNPVESITLLRLCLYLPIILTRVHKASTTIQGSTKPNGSLVAIMRADVQCFPFLTHVSLSVPGRHASFELIPPAVYHTSNLPLCTF